MFRSGWLEALGDLARYHMAVTAMVTNNELKGSSLTTDAVSKPAPGNIQSDNRLKRTLKPCNPDTQMAEAKFLLFSISKNVVIIHKFRAQLKAQATRWH